MKKELLTFLKSGLLVGAFSVFIGGRLFSFASDKVDSELEQLTIEDVANNKYVKDNTFFDELLSSDEDMLKDLHDLETSFRIYNGLQEFISSNNYKVVEICELYMHSYLVDLKGKMIDLQKLSEQEILDLCELANDVSVVNGEYVLTDSVKKANFSVRYLYEYYRNYLNNNAKDVMERVAKAFLKSNKCYLDGKDDCSDYLDNFIKFGTPSNISDSFSEGESAFVVSDIDGSVLVLDYEMSKDFYEVLRLLCYVQDNDYDYRNYQVVDAYRLLLNKIKVCLVSGCKYDDGNVIVPASSKVDVIKKVKQLN